MYCINFEILNFGLIIKIYKLKLVAVFYSKINVYSAKQNIINQQPTQKLDILRGTLNEKYHNLLANSLSSHQIYTPQTKNFGKQNVRNLSLEHTTTTAFRNLSVSNSESNSTSISPNISSGQNNHNFKVGNSIGVEL